MSWLWAACAGVLLIALYILGQRRVYGLAAVPVWLGFGACVGLWFAGLYAPDDTVALGLMGLGFGLAGWIFRRLVARAKGF